MKYEKLIIVLAILIFVWILFFLNEPFKLREVINYYYSHPVADLKNFQSNDLALSFQYPADFSLQGYVINSVADTGETNLVYNFTSGDSSFLIIGKNKDFTPDYLNFVGQCTSSKILEANLPSFSIFQKSFCSQIGLQGIKSWYAIGFAKPNQNLSPIAIATYIPTTGSYKMIIIASSLPSVSKNYSGSDNDSAFLKALQSGRYNEDLFRDLKAFATILLTLKI